MGILSEEQMAKLEADEALGAPPEPTVPPKAEASSAAKIVYEEEETAPVEQPPPLESEPPVIPKTFRAKVQGQEVEMPIFDERGQVNPLLVERVQMGEDYYRKTQSLAEERRQAQAMIEQERAKIKQEYEEQMRTLHRKIKPEGMPDLPEDDDYAKAIRLAMDRAERAEQVATERLAQIEAAVQRQEQMRVEEENRRAYEKAHADVKTKFQLDDATMAMAEQNWAARFMRGEQIDMETGVKQFVDQLAAIKRQEIENWKAKHRVTTEKAQAGGGGAGVQMESAPAPLNMKNVRAAVEAAIEAGAL